MGESMVARAYGDALYEAAKKAGTEAEVLAEVVCLADLMETEDELRVFLMHIIEGSYIKALHYESVAKML